MQWEAVDLYCGLGGWTEGLQAEGYHVVGYDIERHEYGDERYPGELVIEDVLNIHGSRFAHVDLIVASPPCQEYSYMAMPWSLAKAKRAAILADNTGTERARLNRLFDACFRIQREASEAAGRHIPMVVENVRGAQEWVGKAAGHFGSYYLWGDVPLPLPEGRPVKVGSTAFRRTDVGKGARFTSRDCGIEKCNLSQVGFNVAAARALGDDFDSSGYVRTAEDKRSHIGARRKAASALIAKIPLVLSRHVARAWRW